MKRYIFPALLLLTLFGIGSQTINAQEKRLDSSPKAFKTYFAKFRKAVEKNDKTSVASMTKFPFRYGFDEGDEGTMTKAQFIKRFTDIFDDPKEFFTEDNPIFSKDDDGNYYISTENASHLGFIKQGNSFKFVSYIVEP